LGDIPLTKSIVLKTRLSLL